MSKKNCMIIEWKKRDDCWTNIGSPDLVREQKLRGYLETRRHVLLDLSGHKKNSMRVLWQRFIGVITTRRCVGYGIYPVGMHGFTWKWRFGEYYVGSVGNVKREKLEWLADNPFYTKRFAYYVGRKCRAMTIKDVAKELKLDWDTVKTLDKEYMEKQLRRYPVAAPRVIGIDEISIRKGHTYRIVVSDLERGTTDLVWREG